jgi:hypothetical protein
MLQICLRYYFLILSNEERLGIMRKRLTTKLIIQSAAAYSEGFSNLQGEFSSYLQYFIYYVRNWLILEMLQSSIICNYLLCLLVMTYGLH